MPRRLERGRSPEDRAATEEEAMDAEFLAAEAESRRDGPGARRRRAAARGKSAARAQQDPHDPLATPEALPAGLPDRSLLSDDQRRRLRSQRNQEARKAGRSGAGKTAEADLETLAVSVATAVGGRAEEHAEAPPRRPLAPPAPRAAPSGPAQRAESREAAALFAEIQAEQAMRVAELQREIARRRRRRGVFLILRLLLFVVAPSVAAGWWQYQVASDLYVSESAFVVRSAGETPDSGGGGVAAALGAAGPMGMIQDSISVQDFVLSREALDRLDAELGVIARWQAPGLDPWLRLAPDATREDALNQYRRLVEVGYDPAESLIRMKVADPDPEMAAAISSALIRYAEGMVDGLSTRMRRDTVAEAEARAAHAREALTEAHVAESRLKAELEIFSPETAAGGEQSLIAGLENEREALRARLDALLAYAPADDPRARTLRRAIDQRARAIEARRARIYGDHPGRGDEGAPSLDAPSLDAGGIAQAEAELARAKAETAAREQMFLAAQSGLEAARLEARRQISYLAVIVPPARADAPTRPRRLANTALAGLAAFGIYLFASLTVSVLREQFSA